jgi:dihydrolipoamide dehydrogenase
MPHHRLIILGAGTAGLSAWKQARDLTDDMLLIDPGPLGTTCARVGCMPSKALLQIADEVAAAAHLHDAGLLEGPTQRLNGAAVMRRVRELRDRFVAGPLRALEKMDEGFIGAAARFVGPNRVRVGDREYSADAFIIATGTQPFVPADWPDLGDRLVTSDRLFELPELPERVGVIGAGAIGCEIGQGLARLGADVHLFSRGEALAGAVDGDINALLGETLSQALTLHTGHAARPERRDGAVAVRFGEDAIDVDLVVAAIGRRARLDDLGLENLGVPLGDNGRPDFDPETLQVRGAPVWLAGDFNAIRPVMHEAADEGRIAAWHALGPEGDCIGRRTPMGIVFTTPQYAWAGRRSDGLPDGTLTGQSDFGRQGRSIIKGQENGLMKIHAHDDGRLIGAEMLCAGAEHLAHELAWLIQQNVTVYGALKLPFYHPVLEEGLRTALHSLRRQLPEPERPADLPICGAGEEPLPGV